MTELFMNKIYSSIELFNKDVEEFCKNNLINYCKKDSAYIKDSNPKQFKYIEYRCVHWKTELDKQDPEKISKGTGVRKNQTYNAKGCPWVVRCLYQPASNNYKISNIVNHHNILNNDGSIEKQAHPITNDHYLLHSNQRQLTIEQQDEIGNMIKTSAKPALIAKTINDKYKIKLQNSDIYNVKKKVLNDFNPDLSDIQNVDAFIKKRIEIDGHNGFQIAYDQSSIETKIEILYYQNNSMRKLFNDYGELIILGNYLD